METLDLLWRYVLTRTIDDAGIRFRRSVYCVPEAECQPRNQEPAGARASTEALVIESLGVAKQPGLAGAYRELVSVEAQTLQSASHVFPVTLMNLGGGRLRYGAL